MKRAITAIFHSDEYRRLASEASFPVWCDRIEQKRERTMKRILVIEDDKDIVELVRYNLEKDGFQVTSSARRSDGAGAGSQSSSRSFGARPDAAESFRPGHLQGGSQGRQPEPPADLDSDGEGRRSGPRGGSRTRRRRLRHQAVQPARTGGSRKSAFAARRSRHAIRKTDRSGRAANRSGRLSRDPLGKAGCR